MQKQLRIITSRRLAVCPFQRAVSCSSLSFLRFAAAMWAGSCSFPLSSPGVRVFHSLWVGIFDVSIRSPPAFSIALLGALPC